MPALTTAPPSFDPAATATHAKGKWFYGVLIGIWPLAVIVGFAATAFGLATGIALGSSVAAALAVDFILVVVTFAVDDGDVQHASEEA